MRYQLRLLDQNLPGLTREIAQACWHATDGVVQTTLDNTLYRGLYRGIRDVFREHVKANRYCNAASVCEASIPRSRADLLPPHEHYAGEHVRIYLLGPEMPPELLIRELVQAAVKSVAICLPRQTLKGLTGALKRVIWKIIDQRVFPSLRCGEVHLCHANEPYDPWDLRDPINVIQHAS
jgi:hypothetical protein